MELVDKIDMDNKMFKWPGRLSISPTTSIEIVPPDPRAQKRKRKRRI